jgi:hypothetical protein
LNSDYSFSAARRVPSQEVLTSSLRLQLNFVSARIQPSIKPRSCVLMHQRCQTPRTGVKSPTICSKMSMRFRKIPMVDLMLKKRMHGHHSVASSMQVVAPSMQAKFLTRMQTAYFVNTAMDAMCSFHSHLRGFLRPSLHPTTWLRH